MKKIHLLALSALALTSCGTDEVASPAAGLPEARISATIGKPDGRAIGANWEADDIGVTVTGSPSGKMAPLYCNVRYRTESTGPTAEFATSGDDNRGILFQVANEPVTFSAYGPFRDWAVAPGDDGFNAVDMSWQLDRESQKSVDFIHASGATASSFRPNVAFTGDHAFRHVMSRLVIEISTPAAGGFSPSDVAAGSYFLGGMKLEALFNPYTGEAKASGKEAVADWRLNNFAVASFNGNSLTYTVILPPQTLAESLSFRAEIDGQAYYNSSAIRPALESGMSYRYSVTVRKDGISVGSCAVSGWTDGGEENVSSSQTVEQFTAEQVKVGDYVYSDGSFSDGGLRYRLEDGTFVCAGTNPVEGKTCVGVVFHVRGVSSPADESEYAEFEGVPTGYIVSLDQNKGPFIDRDPNGDDQTPSGSINGYKYTRKYYDKYHAGFSLHAIEWCTGHAALPAAGAAKFSQWYMPSLQEYRLMRGEASGNPAVLAVLKANLAKAGGAEFSNDFYSTCQLMGYYGNFLQVLNILSGSTDMGYMRNHVRTSMTYRAVCAFK